MARSSGRFGSLFTMGLALALVLGGVLVPMTTASPAAAALNGAIPANGEGDPTDVFTTQDALTIITLSDVAGGRACVIPEFIDTTCAHPAWGEPNVIVGLGTTTSLLEGPSLEPGNWRLRTEFRKDGDTWEKGSVSDVFTVVPCGPGECLDSLGKEQAQKFKDASTEALGGVHRVCDVARFLASKKKAAIDVAISIVSGDFVSAGIGIAGLVGIEIPTDKTSEAKAIEILNVLSCNVSKMHQDIVDDPPDPDFTVIATADAAVNGPLQTAKQQEYADAMAQQEALGRAALKSYERYQGALLAGDVTYQLRQAQAIDRFTEQLGASLHRSASASRALADSADPLDTALTSYVVFQTQDELDQTTAVFDRLRADGLTAAESGQLDALGLNQSSKADYLARLRQTDTRALTVGGTLSDSLRGQADNLDAAAQSTLQFGRDAANVAVGLGGPPPNQPPTANDDALTTQTAVSGSINVLANDTDSERDRLEVIGTTDPSHGTVTCSTTGDCSYRSADGFEGTDSFGYTIRDTAGGTASATVTVSVTSAPVPPTAAADSVDAVSAHTVDVPVLQNDNDPAGLSLTITAGGPAGHGTVSCLADACHYRSAIGYSGTDEFRYTIRSESGLTAVGTVTVTVTPNGAPVVADQQATITSATPLTVNVLNGSSDPESDPLTVTGNSSPAHGTATCGSATCTYTSIAGYAGDDSFSYSASDGAGGSSDGTVWVTVIENTAPNVTDDTGVTRVGRTTALTIDVVGNDVDAQTPVADTDLAVVTPPAHGTVTCGPRGFEQCHYLAEPTFVGADSFTYRLTDPAGASAVGTVSITVTENHPPAITDPELATFKEIPVSRDVLSYASDPDGDAVSLRIGDQPAHGVVACDPTGTCTYEPAADFVGDDSYTVVVTDGELSTTGTVSVVVRPYCYPAVCIDNGTVLLAVNPYGELNSPDGTGSKAGPGSVGLDFLATNNDATAAGCLCEGWGVANPQTGTAGYANVSSDGGAVNLTLESFTWTASSAVSVVRVGDSLRVTHDYHPSAQTPNLFEVTVTIDNISGATIPDVLYRRVMDWDIEPTAFAEYSTIDTGNASQIRFTNDNGFASANPLAPAEGPQWTSGEFADLGPSDHGALFDFGFGEIPSGGSKVFQTYYGASADEAGAQSALSAVGAEAYSFGQPSTEDGPTLGTPNTFVFAFRSVGGRPVFAPTAVDDHLTVDFETAGSVNVLGNDTDPNGDPLSVTTPSPAAAHGSVSCGPDGSCRYSPQPGFSGADSFSYSIADGTGGTSTATVTVIVLPSPGSPPVAVISPASGPEAAPIALDGSGSTDPDGDTLSYAWDLDADGAFDDASAAITSVTIPVAGSRTVRLQVTDPAGHTALADRTITATNVIPVVSAGADTTTGQERLYSGTGSFVDPGADTWRATIDWGEGAGPELLALDGFTYSTAHFFAGPGEYTVTVRVTDTIGAGAGTDSFVVTVPPPPVNLPPTASLSPTAPTGGEGSPIPVALAASDPESRPLTAAWTWRANPLGLNTPDCALSGTSVTGATITCNENGTVTLSVTVSDGANSVTRSVPVLVTNVAPGVGAISAPADIELGSPLEISASFTDPGTVDTQVCFVLVDGNPVEGAVTGAVCAARITGLAAGSHILELVVTDDDGDSGRAGVTVVVTAPPPPTSTSATSTPATATSVTPTQVTSTPETSASSTSSTAGTSDSGTSTPETSASSTTSTPVTPTPTSSATSPSPTSSTSTSTSSTSTSSTSTSSTSTSSTSVSPTSTSSTSASSTSTASTSASSTPPPSCSGSTPTLDARVWADQPTASTKFTSPKLSTAANGELILAFVSADGPSSKAQKVTEVTGGGLTWSLATRSNETWGTTEIWQARAASKLTNAVVTAKLAGAFDGSIMVATFKGAATTVGAVGAASGKKGAPAVKVSPKYCGSLVWATGHDWSAAQDPKPAAGQSIVHKFIDRRVKDSYWFQKVDAPTATGVPVTVSATGFVTDRWTYVAVEIPRIAG